MAFSSSRFTTAGSLRGPGAVEILDEAASLLRRTPISIIAIYFFGALPFCLGLIYFCSDMAESTNAETRLPVEALLLAILYFGMKTCQAVFSRRLLALLEGGDAEPWTALRWMRTALLQTIYAGSFVILYPLAMLITIPFAAVNAFYHNISTLATGAKSTLGSSFREAADLAGLWPKQNHLILAVMLLAVMALFLNLAVFVFMVPELLNMFFGVQTVFDQNLWAWNNSSFYLDICVFCFLLLNPVNKAVFVLRCFYGRSRLSGADLRAELRRRDSVRTGSKPARATVPALVLLIALSSLSAQAQQSQAAPAPAASPSAMVDPTAGKLNQAIEKTLRKDEFAWRMPREIQPAGDAGFLTKMLDRFGEYLKKASRKPLKELDDFLKWLFENPNRHDSSNGAFSAMAAFPWRALMVFLAVLVAGILLYVGLRQYRQRRVRPSAGTLKLAPIRTIDLEAEHVRADELPEDSWLALAQQLIERGDLRLALRALYLATLSGLARQELVRLAAAKSNRDYLAELTRRLRGETSVASFFRESVRLFEASWYGTHDVTPATIDTMRNNQQKMRGHVAI